MKKINKLTKIVFVLYLLLLTWLVLFKFATSLNDLPHIRGINLIPFRESAIVNGKINLKEIIYNIIVFIPLGVYISIIKNKWNILKKISIGLAVSLTFEILQYIFYIGGSDITDLTGNTFGTFLGITLYQLLTKLFKNKTINIINIIGLVIEILAFALITLLTISNL